MRRPLAIHLLALAAALLACAAAAETPSSAPATASKPALKITVDPRVELICVIFRLAGNPEYQRCKVKSYAADVDKHFGPFRDHAVIQLARKLRRTRGVSYDAPMSLVAHITRPPKLAERIPFDPHPVGLDGRWKTAEVREFLRLARLFAVETKFNEFYRAHADLYAGSIARMWATMTEHGHLEWFSAYFGTPPGGEFRLSLGMLNGPNSYGARLQTDDRLELHSMLGVWQTDLLGRPKFPKPFVGTVVHEFGHSFVNPIVYAHAAKLESAGKRIHAANRKAMKRQAYGNWRTVMCESVLRACSVRYALAHDGPAAGSRVAYGQASRGFTWVPGLAKRLAEYEANRDKYPTFDSFMPRIIDYFNAYADSLPTPATQPSGEKAK